MGNKRRTGGFNTYHVQAVRMKEYDADPMIAECEKKQKEGRLCRGDLNSYKRTIEHKGKKIHNSKRITYERIDMVHKREMIRR